MVFSFSRVCGNLSLFIPSVQQVYSDFADKIMQELGLNDEQNPADLQDWRHPSVKEINFIKSLIRDYSKSKNEIIAV